MNNPIYNNALPPFAIIMARALRPADLPYHHCGPRDGLLVAQALEEDLPLLSPEEILSAYGV